MNKKSKLEKYIELFNRKIAEYLSNNVSINTVVHPVLEEGAVFEVFLNQDGDKSIVFTKPSKTVGHVLQNIPQNMYEGAPEHVQFKGTNLLLEDNRIIIIKSEDSNEAWTGIQIDNDVSRVISTSQGTRTV